jgi:acyl carrier protein
MSDPKAAMAMPPPSMSNWEREIAVLIVEALGLDVGPDSFSPGEPLYEGSLGLDSIDMLEIATVVSQRYGVEIRSGDARNEKIFASLRALADHVARNRSA